MRHRHPYHATENTTAVPHAAPPGPADATAFQELLVDQIPRLRRYAHALSGDRSRGDDLVQECLERAWSRRRLYEPSRPIRPWLFTILHNLYVNQVRRRAGEPVIVSAAEDGVPEPLASDAPGAVEIREVQRAIARLSDEHREILLLVGLEQLTYREAASTLGVPVGTVMSRLARARGQLRQALQMPDGARLRRVK